MRSQKFGPTFAQELVTAGVGGLPFTWSTDGVFQYDESVTAEQREIIEAVAAANNPGAADREAKLSMVRTVRELYLNRIIGIKDAARDAGDTVLVDACKTARQSLLDITNGCPADPVLVDGFILDKYAAIVAGLPQTLIKAFARVDA